MSQMLSWTDVDAPTRMPRAKAKKAPIEQPRVRVARSPVPASSCREGPGGAGANVLPERWVSEQMSRYTYYVADEEGGGPVLPFAGAAPAEADADAGGDAGMDVEAEDGAESAILRILNSGADGEGGGGKASKGGKGKKKKNGKKVGAAKAKGTKVAKGAKTKGGKKTRGKTASSRAAARTGGAKNVEVEAEDGAESAINALTGAVAGAGEEDGDVGGDGDGGDGGGGDGGEQKEEGGGGGEEGESSDEAKAPQGWMGGERHTFHCYGQGNIRPVDPEDYMKTHNAQITDPDQAFKHAYLGMRGVSEESVKLALDKQAASKYDANGRVIVEADENDEEETKQPVKTGGFLDQEPPRNNAVGGGGKSGGKKKRGKKGGKKGDVADPEANMRPVTVKVTARPARFLPVKKKRDDGNNGNNGNNGGDRRSEANGAVVLAGGNGNTGINGLIHSDQQTHADVARREEIRRVAWEEAEYARESAAAVAAYVLREDDVGRQRFLEARQYKHEPFQPFVEDHLNPRTYQRLPPQWTKNIRPAGCKPAVRHTSIADLLNQFA